MLRSGKEIRNPLSSRETQNTAKTSNKQQAAETNTNVSRVKKIVSGSGTTGDSEGEKIKQTDIETNTKENVKAEHPAEQNAVEAGREGEATNSAVTTHEQQQISEKSHLLLKMDDKMEIFFKTFVEKMNQNDASKGNVTIDAFAKVVPNFDGVSIPIRQWISNFDENAEAYELTAKQKYVNARNKMKGTAALLLETITVSNYNSLCEALIEEFDKPLSSAEVHKLLRQRRKQATENFHEYVLQMRKIAALGKVDEQSIITYIADGVELRNEQKYPLYSARSYKELIKAYELVEPLAKHSEANKRRQIASSRKEVDKSSNDGERKNQHCFNCGSTQHKRAECKEDTKCFKCNGSGHMAKQCNTTKQNVVNVVFDEKRMKQLKINNNNVSCLVDTGADVSLMRKSVYDQICSNCELRKSFARLYGLGNVAADVLGEFTTQVVVDELSTQHTFLVVKDSKINVDAIVGYDFLKKFLVILNAKGYNFSRSEDDTNAGETSYNVLNVVHSSNEVDVEPKYKEAVKQLIDNYKPSFIQSNSHIKLNIVPKSNNIILRESPSRLSVMEREFVRKQVAEWLQKGIIRESCSEIASKVVLAKKKDGSYRLCVDFRKLNSMVMKDRFPVPIVEEVLEKMQGAKYFTVMDLANGFFHVEVEEQCKKYTAFVTKEGLYEFNRAPFGFCNSPAVFIRYVNHIFQKLINAGIMEIYVDDIIIFGGTEEQCLDNMQMVLNQAQQYGLEIKWSKCQFLKKRVAFLGHEVENGRIWPGKSKVKAVKNFPIPKNIRDVQAFLGLTGYFRKFIRNYAGIARPLTQLLRKNEVFQIKEEEIKAIDDLKSALVAEPILQIYKQNAETQLHVDASKHGFGATLIQLQNGEWHQVFYWSKKTSPQEEKLHSYFLEVKAAYLATKKLRHYLMGIQFTLVTDCAAFKQTNAKKDIPREVVQWLMYLQDFAYNIEHRSGNRMKHVDSLSRFPVMTVTSEVQAQIARAQKQDSHLTAVAEILKEKPYENFKLKNQLVYKQVDGQDVLAIPKSMENEIIKETHRFGHMGGQKTMHAIRQSYYIPHLEKKVQQVIQNCVECIMHNHKLGKKEDYLHCIDKGDSPLSTLHVDHLGTLDTTSKCYKYIFAIVDGFSKYTWIYPTKSTDAQEVVRHLESWVTIFGSPLRIISDKGTAYTSKLFKEFCAKNKIDHVEVTTGVPRGNGQSERVNRVIISILAKMSAKEPDKWYKYTSQVQRAINSHVHSSTKFTPFEVMFGVKMRNEADIELLKVLQEELLVVAQNERNQIRQEARKQILKAQEVYKSNYDRKRKGEHGYQISDLVAIKVTQFVTGKKLASKYIGPYQVSKVKRHGRYDVKKVGDFRGPSQTSTSADNMKLWRYYEHNEDDHDEESSEAYDNQDDRV